MQKSSLQKPSRKTIFTTLFVALVSNTENKLCQ